MIKLIGNNENGFFNAFIGCIAPLLFPEIAIPFLTYVHLGIMPVMLLQVNGDVRH